MTEKEVFWKKLSDPGCFQENRLPAHSDHAVFGPADSEEKTDAKKSSLRKYLNGEWKFFYSPNFASAPEGFEKPDYPVDSWDDIHVPGHIQLQGYDRPQYVNTQYPWDGREELDAGEVPKEFNPVASYVTKFTLPGYFQGKRVILSFQGVESVFRCWLNGTYIGFSSDTFTPSEFEVTDFLKEGENTLAVQVLKWYCGSWLEDQDFFRFSGIFRDVYLMALPEHHVYDLGISADYDPENPKEGRIEAEISCLKEGADVFVSLFSPEGDLLKNEGVTWEDAKKGKASFLLTDPKLWSAEQPDLYELLFTVKNRSGETEEWIRQRVGIRHFQMDGTLMKLNGRRIVFKGVNRHEFSSRNGRVVSEEELRKDLLTMKRNNINAIRLCHYPNSSPIYELADSLGFYLIDECNMESHGTWDMVERGLKGPEYALPGDHVEYQEMLLDRIRSMVLRDRNHPCILIWSCGNESFGGPVIHAMSRELKKLDPSRLVHYEGIFHDRRFPDTSDMESQMYTPVSGIREFLKEHRDKPFICCEYSHAMGNSCGALYKYTDLAEEEELYQGGFIWDYVDQALLKKDRYQKEYFGYGGDFEDRPNDGDFSGDGIVDADRNPTPKLPEVKYCYQNMAVRFPEEGFPASFTVINRNLFTSTSRYDCFVMLEKDGEPVKEVRMDTDVPALSEKSFPVPFEKPETSGEYGITVSFRLKEGTDWAEKGHEIAFGQKMHTIGKESSGKWENGKRTDGSSLKVIGGSYNIGVQGKDFEALFSRLYGGLVSYRYRGKELLSGMVRANFWRAPVDNDYGWMEPFRYAPWKVASLYQDHKNPADLSSFFRLENPKVVMREEKVTVTYTCYLPVNPEPLCRLSYTLDAEGETEVTLSYEPPKSGDLPDFPEFSVIFKLDADFDRLSWYGKGPQDTYPDRKKGARVGIYRQMVSEQSARYLLPQESGNHEDVRWLKICNEEGYGLSFTCNLLGACVSPWSPHELEAALHPTELPPVHYTWIRIGKQMGIGGDDTWGSTPHEEFLLSSKQPREITFRFSPVAP